MSSVVDGWVFKSEKELRAVEKLRERLLDLQHEQDATHNLSDSCLVRFVRCRKLKLDQAEKLYRETATWRKELDPIRIAETYQPGNLITTFRPGGFLGCDKLGCPIFYDRIGQADPKVLAHLRRCPAEGKDVSGTDQLRDYEILKQEVLTEVFKRCSEKEGREIYQTFVVQDLRGLGSHHITTATMDVVRAVLGVLDERYPLRFRKLIIIYPPFIFSMAWNIVKHFVHETTREQVEVVSGDPSAALLEHIDADQLPKALGGTLIINGDEYCNPPIVPGGRIPKDFSATPSVYRTEKSGLPMHLYVPARRSVKIGPYTKVEEILEPEVVAPESFMEFFQRTIEVVTEWVRNLGPDDEEVEEILSEKVEELDGSEKFQEATAIQDVSPEEVRHEKMSNPACCACVIS